MDLTNGELLLIAGLLLEARHKAQEDILVARRDPREDYGRALRRTLDTSLLYGRFHNEALDRGLQPPDARGRFPGITRIVEVRPLED
jgi:hypothetical protein